jgi:hypothetical protein
MADVKATFYLPLKDNDGRRLTSEIGAVEDACYEDFGAWTLTGLFQGVWRMKTGERKMDTSAVYMIVLAEERLPELEAIIRSFKAKTQQESIFLEVERNVDVRFL